MKRIAVVATIYQYLKHAQHFADRFLVGYPYGGEWRRPDTRIVSLYVDQHPVGDQSVDRGREFGFDVYPTIAEALRCGGDKLAVDGVLIIGEHGEYPSNELGQKLYPRYEFFKQVVEVFEADGRSVPVYNDKHLSYSFEKAREMVADGKRLDFPMLAGSSLPVTWRLPDLELPLGCELEDAVMIGCGGSDPMDYHVLEAMQCMVERRHGALRAAHGGGGESTLAEASAVEKGAGAKQKPEQGVAAVEMVVGDGVWEALESGRIDRELLEAALSRCDAPQGHALEDGRVEDLLGTGELKRLVEEPAAYFIEYRDGFQAVMLMLNGGIKDYCFAARVKGEERPVSCQFFVTPTPNVDYSASLVHKIEEMLTAGVSPIPAERTQVVSGMLEACLKSKVMGKRLETPALRVCYAAPVERQHFCT